MILRCDKNYRGGLRIRQPGKKVISNSVLSQEPREEEILQRL